MAVARQKLRFDKTRRKSGKTTKTKRGKGPSGEETAPLDGAECLRQAVDRRLGWNSEMLADILEAKALNGDLATTKVMVVLAAGKKPEPVKKRNGRPGLRKVSRNNHPITRVPYSNATEGRPLHEPKRLPTLRSLLSEGAGAFRKAPAPSALPLLPPLEKGNLSLPMCLAYCARRVWLPRMR